MLTFEGYLKNFLEFDHFFKQNLIDLIVCHTENAWFKAYLNKWDLFYDYCCDMFSSDYIIAASTTQKVTN